MYGRVNNIPFDIVANGANLNKENRHRAPDVQKMLFRNISQNNGHIYNMDKIKLQKMRMEIKTQLSNPYVITGWCRRSYDDK